MKHLMNSKPRAASLAVTMSDLSPSVAEVAGPLKTNKGPATTNEKIRFVLRNMDSIWFGRPHEVLESIGSLDGVTSRFFAGRFYEVKTEDFNCTVRVDDSRPGFNGPRDVPKAYVISCHMLNDLGEWQAFSISCI